MDNYESRFLALAMPIVQMYANGNTGPQIIDACSELFNYSQDVRPNKLLQCSPKSLQPIGCAFAILAININYGNPDINSISAENALYCLVSAYKNNPNSFGNIPYNAIVSLLLSDPNLLKDAIMHVLKNNPHFLYSLSEQMTFRSGENSVRYRILKYMIPYIFDFEKLDYKVSNMPLAPDKELLLNCINSSYYKSADGEEGEKLFEELFDYCETGVSL